MPTYVYRCADCDHDFEQYQAFTDDALTDCPACGAASLRKVFNSIGVSFTGSGFYRNDSRAGGKDAGASASAAPKTPDAAAPAPAKKDAPAAAASAG